MQAIRRIVKRKSIKAVSVPQEFGDTVEIIVLSVKETEDISAGKPSPAPHLHAVTPARIEGL